MGQGNNFTRQLFCDDVFAEGNKAAGSCISKTDSGRTEQCVINNESTHFP